VTFGIRDQRFRTTQSFRRERTGIRVARGGDGHLATGCPLYAHTPSQTGSGCADGSVVVIVVDSVGGEARVNSIAHAPSSPRRYARDGGGSDEQGFHGVSHSFCRGRCFFVDACKALQQAVGWPADIEL
jgi:hypothetical protein